MKECGISNEYSQYIFIEQEANNTKVPHQQGILVSHQKKRQRWKANAKSMPLGHHTAWVCEAKHSIENLQFMLTCWTFIE